MSWTARYLRLIALQARVSATLAMQYRLDFVLKGGMAVFWLAVTLLPLYALFDQRPTLAGWTLPEALVVMGWFILLKALLDGAVNPSLLTVVEGIRDGRFDFILLKPADSQFLVSTARFEPWRVFDVLGALAVFGYAFTRLPRWPAPAHVAAALALLLLAVLLLYSLWLMVVCLSFWVVKVDNLSYLMASLFDAARWPVTVFPPALRIIFTFVFPLALMTTYPALALLGRLGPGTVLACSAGCLSFAALARLCWRRALAAYTSASS